MSQHFSTKFEPIDIVISFYFAMHNIYPQINLEEIPQNCSVALL